MRSARRGIVVLFVVLFAGIFFIAALLESFIDITHNFWEDIKARANRVAYFINPAWASAEYLDPALYEKVYRKKIDDYVTSLKNHEIYSSLLPKIEPYIPPWELFLYLDRLAHFANGATDNESDAPYLASLLLPEAVVEMKKEEIVYTEYVCRPQVVEETYTEYETKTEIVEVSPADDWDFFEFTLFGIKYYRVVEEKIPVEKTRKKLTMVCGYEQRKEEKEIPVIRKLYTYAGDFEYDVQEQVYSLEYVKEIQEKNVGEKNTYLPNPEDLKNFPEEEFVVTGYTAGEESTGKKPGDPGYGVTASGVYVHRDPDGLSTVAADPDVLPFGSIIYVEGYGYGIVEDTGGAIKGKRLDLYFETVDEALKWGKRTVKVKIIQKGTGKIDNVTSLRIPVKTEVKTYVEIPRTIPGLNSQSYARLRQILEAYGFSSSDSSVYSVLEGVNEMRKLYAEKTSSDFIPFFPPVGVSVSEYIAYSSSIDIHTMTVKPSAHYVAIAKNYYEKRKELISEISWPVPGVASITSAFGYRLDPITGRSGTFHTGVDIADANVAGKPVVAFADGAVTYAGWLGGYGLVVIVDHGEGLSTLYAHLSQLFVKNGDNVKTGQLLGAVGSTGRSTGPHLHFEIRINGQPTDPLAHFFVLKPLSQEFREGDRGIDN